MVQPRAIPHDLWETRVDARLETTARTTFTRPDADTERCRRDLTDELFRDVETTDSEPRRQDLRSSIVCVNMPMARAVARRYENRGEQADDLHQVAYLGLTKAVSRFRIEQERDFLTYAVPTITGELKRHFRDRCWTVRPPRRVQDLQQQANHVVETETRVRGTAPSVLEIAELVGATEAAVREALSANGCFTPASLDVPVGETGEATVADLMASDEGGFSRVESAHVLGPVWRSLSETEREMVALWVLEGWTQQRIGRRVHLTQIQVSRAISAAFARVREQIGPVR